MTLELTVKTEDAGTRLDAFIAAHAPELTRSQAARLIEEGGGHGRQLAPGQERPRRPRRVGCRPRPRAAGDGAHRAGHPARRRV